MRHDPAIIHEARVLRQAALVLEDRLWHQLRDRRFHGLKFRRQATVGPLVVSFLCAAQGLVILVGEDEHASVARIAALRLRGWRVLLLDGGSEFSSALSRIAGEVGSSSGSRMAGSG